MKLQVVDPHVHFWDLRAHRYPWLDTPGTNFLGDYSSIAATHLPEDFQREAGDIEVLKVVHIDAGHDPADPVAETRWLKGLADSAGGPGFPQAIVAAADLSQPGAARVLAEHAAFANVRGIRQILNVHSSPIYDFVGRHFLREPAWRANFAALAAHQFSFDLQIYPSQMQEAAELARAHPDIPIILNHAGMFADRDHVSGWRAWRDGLRALAACANISVKISGLGMFDHAWTVESLRPYVLEAIDAFGPERAMFASNFPVDRLFSSYATLWRAYETIATGATGAERAALFRGNAERIYRL